MADITRPVTHSDILPQPDFLLFAAWAMLLRCLKLADDKTYRIAADESHITSLAFTSGTNMYA